MIDYIKGQITELTPAYAVLETNGVGYYINIALPTYTALSGKESTKLYVYEVIREDAHLLFGFTNKVERELFLLLISVSGVGANTARMIMSSYTAIEIKDMIASGNVASLNSIKGIGAKTAQRIIVDLRDKILKIGGNDQSELFANNNNSIREEAVSALVMLGFVANASQKAVDSLIKEQPDLKVEQLIKLALKML